MSVNGHPRRPAYEHGRRRHGPMKVKDVMGHVAIAVVADASFADILAALRRFKVGAVAVVDGDRRVLGVVSEDDLLLREIDPDRPDGPPPLSPRRREERRKATGTTAGEIMTRPAITVTRETPVSEAARLMHDHRIKQLPVVNPENGRIVGTVHQSDLLKVLAARRDEEAPAGEPR
jgi:CBS domain-containing protein